MESSKMNIDDIIATDLPPTMIGSYEVQGYIIPKELMKEIYYYIFDKSEDGEESDGWELLEKIRKFVDVDKMLE